MAKVDIESVKPNSHKYKEEQKQEAKKEKVISGSASRKKKSEVSKLANSIVSEDANNIKNYILDDVLIPSLKKTIFDMVTNGIDLLLYGEVRDNKGRRSSSGRVSYVDYYDKSSSRDCVRQARSRSSYDFDDIEFDSFAEADAVLYRMQEQIDRFDGCVSVADMYEFSGLEANFTDYKYGWTSLRGVQPYRTRNGKYILKMPKASPLN